MSTTIENLQGKVWESICDYENYNMYEDTTIEEFVRNEAENSPAFFQELFGLDHEISYNNLTEEQLKSYEDFVSEVVATYEAEYSEDEE